MEEAIVWLHGFKVYASHQGQLEKLQVLIFIVEINIYNHCTYENNFKMDPPGFEPVTSGKAPSH